MSKPFSYLPVPPPSTTFTVAEPLPLVREKQFFWGVKIAAAIISLLILIAVLWKYWRKSSSGGQTVAVQVQPPSLNMTDFVAVQVQPPALNITDFVQVSV
uniref:Uncharacterized protein n=1 Tax=Fagus sylvatica TaxID=28930 RepID=A0A2N9GNY3_FAGSY